MKDALKTGPSSVPKGSRSYSTMTTPASGGVDMEIANSPSMMAPEVAEGTKFGLVSLPLPKDGHVKHRYDPLVDQFTNLLMRDGQKSVAQRVGFFSEETVLHGSLIVPQNMALILQHLRTSPIPTINPNRPLIAGAPPPSHLPLNPVLYLTLAIDTVAPLLRIRSQKG
jgi:small subunit ribosomal protein S7